MGYRLEVGGWKIEEEDKWKATGEDSEEAGLRCSRPSIAWIRYSVKYFINSISVRTIWAALVVEEKGLSGEVVTHLQLKLSKHEDGDQLLVKELLGGRH